MRNYQKYFSREIRDLIDAMLSVDPDDRPELGEICAVSSSMHEKHSKMKAERKARKEGKTKK